MADEIENTEAEVETIDLYHPELDVRITVPKEGAWVRLENDSGWEEAPPLPPEPEPTYYEIPKSQPSKADRQGKED